MAENNENNPKPSEDVAPVSRRSFLGKAALLIHGMIGAVVAFPLIAAIFAPGKTSEAGGSGEFIPVGDLDDFPADTPTRVPVIGSKQDAWTREEGVVLGSVWVIRNPSDTNTEVSVYAAECPHLGCAIKWNDAHFHCPCHGSQFALGGERLELEKKNNPSPRDMDRLESRIEAGKILVRFQRFETGEAKQIPIV